MRYKTQIDPLLEQFSENWKIGRMSCVDRNVMRIALYEMLFCEDIPHKVSINEAIDIGKKFGDSESGAFINGILDKIRLGLESGRIQARPEEFDRVPKSLTDASSDQDIPPKEQEEEPAFMRIKGREGVVKRRMPLIDANPSDIS
jgi:N utilization substance protein B